MNLKTQFTTVTSFSKIVAAALFISLPFFGFWLGTKFQKSLPNTQVVLVNNDTSVSTPIPTPEKKEKLPDACTDERLMNQAGINTCSQTLYDEANSKLAKIYALILKEPIILTEVDPQQKEREDRMLKKSQDLWKKYVDAECEYESDNFYGGSAWPMMYSGCQTNLTKKRIDDLLDVQKGFFGEIPSYLKEYSQN